MRESGQQVDENSLLGSDNNERNERDKVMHNFLEIKIDENPSQPQTANSSIRQPDGSIYSFSRNLNNSKKSNEGKPSVTGKFGNLVVCKCTPKLATRSGRPSLSNRTHCSFCEGLLSHEQALNEQCYPTE